MNQRQTSAKIGGIGQVVESVEAGDRELHGTVKLKIGDVLQKPEHLVREICLLGGISCQVEHLGREIDARHIVAASAELESHSARAATEVEN